jgi:hypothetical protein
MATAPSKIEQPLTEYKWVACNKHFFKQIVIRRQKSDGAQLGLEGLWAGDGQHHGRVNEKKRLKASIVFRAAR